MPVDEPMIKGILFLDCPSVCLSVNNFSLASGFTYWTILYIMYICSIGQAVQVIVDNNSLGYGVL